MRLPLLFITFTFYSFNVNMSSFSFFSECMPSMRATFTCWSISACSSPLRSSSVSGNFRSPEMAVSDHPGSFKLSLIFGVSAILFPQNNLPALHSMSPTHWNNALYYFLTCTYRLSICRLTFTVRPSASVSHPVPRTNHTYQTAENKRPFHSSS